MRLCQRIYIWLFGIPEIGMQVRSLYFKKYFSKIKFKKDCKVLDAGSGIGLYSFFVADTLPSSKIIGVDIDKDKIRFCENIARQQDIDNVTFVFKDLEKQNPETNSYDLIINIDVLEHVKKYKKILQNFYNALHVNGYLFIHTPHINQTRVFKSLENWSHEGHVREGFEMDQFISELKSIGFKIVYKQHTFGMFGSLAWELNHLFLGKSFILAGISYPFLYLLARLDLVAKNKRGLGIAVLAKK